MNSEIEEFEQTSTHRRNQLAETQKLAIEKYDKDCLTRYGINMSIFFEIHNNSKNHNNNTLYSGESGNTITVNNNNNTSTSLSSSSSQTSLTTPQTPILTQNTETQNLSNLINNTTNNSSSSIQPTNLTPASSALQFVGSANNHQKIFNTQSHYQPGNRSSLLVTSSDYLKSQPQYISMQQHHQQMFNQVYSPPASILTFTDNSLNNNNKPVTTNQGVAMREHRSTSLINQMVPHQITQQPRSTSTVASANNASTVVSSAVNTQTSTTAVLQVNRRNSTAFT